MMEDLKHPNLCLKIHQGLYIHNGSKIILGLNIVLFYALGLLGAFLAML